MPKNYVFWILGTLAVAGLAWLIFSDRGKSILGIPSKTPRIGSESSQPQNQVATRIAKNGEGTLSLFTVNSKTGQVISERKLSFSEAARLAGGERNVCAGAYNVGGAYAECATIRTRV